MSEWYNQKCTVTCKCFTENCRTLEQVTVLRALMRMLHTLGHEVRVITVSAIGGVLK